MELVGRLDDDGGELDVFTGSATTMASIGAGSSPFEDSGGVGSAWAGRGVRGSVASIERLGPTR